MPLVENRVAAAEMCFNKLNSDETMDGIVREDIRRKCEPTKDERLACHPQFSWVTEFFKSTAAKKILGIPGGVDFVVLNKNVTQEFFHAGDVIKPHHLLLPPLIADGIRVLYTVGAVEALCTWPGILSSLKLLPNFFQSEFLQTSDIPWDSGTSANVTVRAVGNGAGNFTYIRVEAAGHFVVQDQPELVKTIVEHWIMNKRFH